MDISEDLAMSSSEKELEELDVDLLSHLYNSRKMRDFRKGCPSPPTRSAETAQSLWSTLPSNSTTDAWQMGEKPSPSDLEGCDGTAISIKDSVHINSA